MADLRAILEELRRYDQIISTLDFDPSTVPLLKDGILMRQPGLLQLDARDKQLLHELLMKEELDHADMFVQEVFKKLPTPERMPWDDDDDEIPDFPSVPKDDVKTSSLPQSGNVPKVNPYGNFPQSYVGKAFRPAEEADEMIRDLEKMMTPLEAKLAKISAECTRQLKKDVPKKDVLMYMNQAMSDLLKQEVTEINQQPGKATAKREMAMEIGANIRNAREGLRIDIESYGKPKVAISIPVRVAEATQEVQQPASHKLEKKSFFSKMRAKLGGGSSEEEPNKTTKNETPHKGK